MASTQLRRGEVYLAGLQPTHIICPHCHQRSPLSMKCRNCGKTIQISHVQRGRRPVIIVQEDRFNAYFDTVLVIPLTSNLKALRFEGVVEVKKTSENGLREDS